MAGSQQNVAALEKRYGYTMLGLYVFAFFLTPLYNSLTPIFGIPLFIFMAIIVIPVVSVVITWVHRANALKALSQGGGQA